MGIDEANGGSAPDIALNAAALLNALSMISLMWFGSVPDKTAA